MAPSYTKRSSRSSTSKKREPLSPLNKDIIDSGTTPLHSKKSVSNPPFSNQKESPKVSKRSSRSVRRKTSPYLDVPVASKVPNSKARLLRQSKESQKQAQISPSTKGDRRLSPNKLTNRISSPSTSNPAQEQANDSLIKKRSQFVERADESSSSLIQNILKDSFETRVKGMLPPIWSPTLPTQTSVDQLRSLLLAKDSIIDSNFGGNLGSAESSLHVTRDSLITDSRTSTPTQSPSKANHLRETLEPPSLYLSDRDLITKDIEQSSTKLASRVDETFPDIENVSGLSVPSPPENQVLATIQPLPQRRKMKTERMERSPSPIEERKTVGFSDEIERFSTPPPSSPLKIVGPLKSILKAKEVLADSTAPFTNFESTSFWISGAIVQLPAGSNDNVLFLDRAVRDLADPNFDFKFEAYTSINSIFKFNSTHDCISWFCSKCIELLNYIRRDISKRSDYGNPFASRTIIQSLKLLSFFFSNESLNKILSGEVARGFILQCCKLIQSNDISKGMASMLLQLLRDQRFSKKVVTPKVGEFILQAILNMRTFSSISLTIERIGTLKEYIKNNFTMLQKNLKVWLSFLFINITDTTSLLSSRIVAAASLLLSEICLKFMDDKLFKFALFQLIHQPLSVALSCAPSQSESQVDSDSLKNDPRLLDYVCEKLEFMISTNNATVAMDIWLFLTLLLNRDGKNEGLESWEGIKIWVKVVKEGLSSSNVECNVSSIKAWRAVIYSCLRSWIKNTNSLDQQKMFSLVTYPFTCNSLDNFLDSVVEKLHSLFLMTLYAFYNFASLTYKTNYSLMDEVWGNLVEPVCSQLYLHQVGTVSGPLLKASLVRCLFGSDAPSKKPDLLRCLRPDSIKLNDIISLPSRWVYQHPRILQSYLRSVLVLSNLSDFTKIEIFIHYLNCLKMSISREMKQTGKIAAEVTAGLPLLVHILFQNITISSSTDFIFDLLIRINDALGIGGLIDDSKDARNSCYTIISKIISYANYSPKRLIELCKFISNTLGHRLQLAFYQDLLDFRNDVLRSFVTQKLKERNFSKTTSREYVYLGEILKALRLGEIDNTFIVLLMGHVLNPIAEKHPVKALESLQIENWNIQLFSCAIFQMMDSQSKHSTARSPQIENIMKFLISQRLSSGDPMEGLAFIEQLCVPSRRLELLKYANLIKERLNSIHVHSGDGRKRTEVVCLKITSLFLNDQFGMDMFKSLGTISKVQHDKSDEKFVVDEHLTTLTSSLPAEIVVEASLASSSDTMLISSSAQTFEMPKVINSSLELIMENDDSQGMILSSDDGLDDYKDEKIISSNSPSNLNTANECDKENEEPQQYISNASTNLECKKSDLMSLEDAEKLTQGISQETYSGEQIANTQVIEVNPEMYSSPPGEDDEGVNAKSDAIFEDVAEEIHLAAVPDDKQGVATMDYVTELDDNHTKDIDQQSNEGMRKRNHSSPEFESSHKKQKTKQLVIDSDVINVDPSTPRIDEGEDGSDEIDLSSISSLSDVDFECSDIELEYTRELTKEHESTVPSPLIDVLTTDPSSTHESSLNTERVADMKENGGEDDGERARKDTEVSKVNESSFDDGEAKDRITPLLEMIDMVQRIDVWALEIGEKEKLENELLRLIMRLRGLD